jgi:predicted nucleotidyltransferase component of viral defense system
MMNEQPGRPKSTEVYHRLRRIAREQGRQTDELFQMYLLERFLFRWATSKYAGQFVLKGGTLLAAYDLRRATRDIDVQILEEPYDVATITGVAQAISQLEVDDGVTFDSAQLNTRIIREDATHPGARLRIPARLATAQLMLQIDINIGDPITPNPELLEYPQLLGGSFQMLGYPLASVLAEKIVTMMELREANTRDRDVGDIVRVLDTHSIKSDDLFSAITATAAYRNVSVRTLASCVPDLATRRQVPWLRWRNRMGLDNALPEQFQEAIEQVVAFADPIIDGSIGNKTWDPQSQAWR